MAARCASVAHAPFAAIRPFSGGTGRGSIEIEPHARTSNTRRTFPPEPQARPPAWKKLTFAGPRALARLAIRAGLSPVASLTGQRRDEVAAMSWKKLTSPRRLYPGERCKNGEEHTVHKHSPFWRPCPGSTAGTFASGFSKSKVCKQTHVRSTGRRAGAIAAARSSPLHGNAHG